MTKITESPTNQQDNLPGNPAILAWTAGTLFLVAAAMRAWEFSHLGLNHFDEGVYAYSGLWPFRRAYGSGLYPWQKLFSPPGYFGFIGIVNWFRGRALDLNAIGINVVLGSLTVLLVFWAGKRFFGPMAGTSAAALVALSEFQVTLSRTALTDTGFSFLFLLTLVLTAICMEARKPLWAVPAGLAAGAAWNFKYHGWLLVAVAFVIVLLEAARQPVSLDRAKILFRCWTVLLVVSTACFLPWMLYVQYRMDGYASVEEFHRRFFNFHWIYNFSQFAEIQYYFDGWMTRISPAIAFLCVAFSFRSQVSFAAFRWIVATVFFLLLFAGALFTGFGLCLLLAALCVPALWRAKNIFANLLLCALLILFVLLPCYTPYVRLMQPWSLMILMLAGFGIQQLLHGQKWRVFWGQAAGVPQWKLAALAVCSACVAAVSLYVFQRPVPRTWEATTSAKDDTAQMIRLIPSNSTVFVVAEPEIAFYFKQNGLRTFCINGIAYRGEPLPHPFIYRTDKPIYVVGGFYGRMQSDWDTLLQNRASQFRFVTRLPFQPSDVRLVDEFLPKAALSMRSTNDPRYDLLLYEFLPVQSAAPSSD